MKTTSLHANHIALNAKMVDFGGFDMPLFYSSITHEHQQVRQKAGIFDVSHMGELIITGNDALRFTNYILTNTITENTLKVTYALLCDHDGMIMDDLLVYVMDVSHVLLVVNASNTQKDYEWILSQKNDFDIDIKNVSETYSQIAIQGPDAAQLCTSLFTLDMPLKFMEYTSFEKDDQQLIISRTGYTGEDGYEIYGSHQTIIDLWHQALRLGITPCGLGARDTLRFEATLPLYGHELSNQINPIEAGLSFAVKSDTFIGSKAIEHFKAHPTKKLVGIKMLDKGIPREGYKLYNQEVEVGYVTTGYLLPTQASGLALAYVNMTSASLGTSLTVEIRGKHLACQVVKKTFMKKNYKKGE
jgi:aminomethyltransferase